MRPARKPSARLPGADGGHWLGVVIGMPWIEDALRGLSGLEWAAAIPGTVGGAVYGNAGAFGSDVSRTLLLAEILHPTLGIQTWKPDQFEYGYRTSILKRNHNFAVLLSAQFLLQPASVEEAKAHAERKALSNL